MIDDDVFVIDAVTHAYDLRPSNYAEGLEDIAAKVSDLVYDFNAIEGLASANLTREEYLKNWTPEETANMLFRESHTDFAVFHPTPIYFYEDGMTSKEKTAEVAETWPDRFATYATVDPLQDDAIEQLERQAEMFDPIGLKFYPTSWADSDKWNDYTDWKLDDPSIAYPIYERAKELGMNTMAVHKSVPLGPYPMEVYRPDDVEAAATNFPDLNFELVHGGLAFSEEVGWQLDRYPNVYINLETVAHLPVLSPNRFAKIIGDMMAIGGEAVLDNLVWGTGAVQTHPQPLLEAFWEYEHPDDFDMEGLLFEEIPDLTKESKRKILGENYARMHDLDIEELQENIEGDEYEQARADGLEAPYETSYVPAPAGD